jgi:hypothetical protein
MATSYAAVTKEVFGVLKAHTVLQDAKIKGVLTGDQLLEAIKEVFGRHGMQVRGGEVPDIALSTGTSNTIKVRATKRKASRYSTRRKVANSKWRPRQGTLIQKARNTLLQLPLHVHFSRNTMKDKFKRLYPTQSISVGQLDSLLHTLGKRGLVVSLGKGCFERTTRVTD